jgi:hypothetical protein
MGTLRVKNYSRRKLLNKIGSEKKMAIGRWTISFGFMLCVIEEFV